MKCWDFSKLTCLVSYYLKKKDKDLRLVSETDVSFPSLYVCLPLRLNKTIVLSPLSNPIKAFSPHLFILYDDHVL